MSALEDLATLTPLDAGPRDKECTVAWLYRVLDPKASEALRRALANENAPAPEIVKALVTDHGIPERHCPAGRLNHHRRNGCACPR